MACQRTSIPQQDSSLITPLSTRLFVPQKIKPSSRKILINSRIWKLTHPCSLKIVSTIRKYHNHNTTDIPVAPQGRATQPSREPGRQTKQSNQLSFFPVKMIAKLEWTQSNAQQNIEQLQNPTMGDTINNESTTTKPPP